MSYIQSPLFIIYECLWFSWGAQVTREFRSSQNLQGIVEGQVADRPPVAPGDKTSRRLQSTLAEAFKPLETFDCPGTVSLIGFNLKSFTQIAKRCIFSTKLISSRCYRCWWFHVSYFHHQRIIWAPIMTLSFFLVDLHWSVMVSCFYIPTSEDVNDHWGMLHLRVSRQRSRLWLPWLWRRGSKFGGPKGMTMSMELGVKTS